MPIDVPDPLRTAVAAAIGAHPDHTPTSAAKAIGRDGTYIRDFLNGKKDTIGAREIDLLEQLLGTPLRAGALSLPEKVDAPPLQYRPPPEILGPRDLPVFSAVEGGPGEMVVHTDPIEWVQRPWFLREVKEGYAVVVTGESMVPVYEPGDIVIINPRLPAVPNKNAIFVGGEEHGEFVATVKRLTRSTTKEWHVRQHNPPEGAKADFALSKSDWPKALRIVGKYEGG